ncbi:MAG TPA: hypothetical protein VHM20_05185, partial [Gammaproteobacteria bacterium]|nr:hypothetical protein [Gammaproteobacteria bacterium]
LKNGAAVLVMGEYHNKGALSPTVGARFRKDDNIYTHLKNAFARKRLGTMEINHEAKIKDDMYYSLNEKQGFSRLTFVQHVHIDLSEEEFQQQYIEPMHSEALRQKSVSEFFWKLDETFNKKDSRYSFKSDQERIEYAKKALININSAKFKLDDKIIQQLEFLQNPNATWEEKIPPLEFYGKNGGRKYSELTAFYLMPLDDLAKHFGNPKIKKDPEKPTIYVECKNQPKEEKWKKLFIFEEEVNVLVDLLKNYLNKKECSTSLFLSTPWKNLPSPWIIEMKSIAELEKVNANNKKLVSK